MTEFCTPNRAFVSDEGADPIAGPFAQHRVPILAARDKKVRAVIQKRRKREVGDGPCVPGRHERHSFMRVRHFPFVIVKKMRLGRSQGEEGRYRGRDYDGRRAAR